MCTVGLEDVNSFPKLSRGDPRCSPVYKSKSVRNPIVPIQKESKVAEQGEKPQDMLPTYLRSEDRMCQTHKRECIISQPEKVKRGQMVFKET